MRRRVLTATLLILAAALPVYSQHRGMGGAPRVGASVGVRSGGRVVVRGGGFGFGVRSGFGFGRDPRFRVFVGSRPFFRHHRFFVASPFGFAWPYTAYPYYGVGLQSDLIYSGPTQQAVDAYGAQTAALSNEVSVLQAELDQIRQAQALRVDQQQYVPPAARMQAPLSAPPAAKPAPEPAPPPTVLIFRDGRKLEVQNYAVTGPTLWIFSEHQARKHPLAELDLDATRKANQDRGVEFASAR